MQATHTRDILFSQSGHSTAPNTRLYAVGDIHGRLDLLEQLLGLIKADSVDSTDQPHLIFLGDYIDRGLHSAGVIDALLALPASHTVFLLGNHEQVMTRVLAEKNAELLHDWLRFGGRETLQSYGIYVPISPSAFKADDVINALQEKLPPAHLRFLQQLDGSFINGDYFFCHAGVRPGVPLAQQSLDDLAWIRRDFIPHQGAYEKMIIHGHTVREQPDVQQNRIGIDTGAYATGRLTALALEGNKHWFLHTN